MDEDKSKHGKLIDKKIICPPDDILQAKYDFILVMVKYYKQILCILDQFKVGMNYRNSESLHKKLRKQDNVLYLYS